LPRLSAIPPLTLVAALTTSFTPAKANVHVWERWERPFTSTATYANPYADVDFLIRITSPDNTVSQVRGFWDSGATWRVRFAFPTPGLWRYSTICSNPNDAGLHNRTGTVLVEPYTGDNPLYRSGFPRPRPQARYFHHRDLSPFFYLADTAWEPWIYLTSDEWWQYLGDRAAKGFTVIQTANGFNEWWESWADGGCPGSATSGIPPWFGDVGHAEQYNPVHFQKVDHFVQLANMQGLVVAVKGLMNGGDHDIIDEETRRRFEQTFAARLQGNAVILSPSVDDPWAMIDVARDAGAGLRADDDTHYRQGLTYHISVSAHGCDQEDQPGNYSCHLHSESWVDFDGYQSGHNKPQEDQMIYWSVRRALEMPLYYYGLTPAKPAVNIEPLYEMPLEWFPSNSDLDDLEYRCRQIGWYTYLSGGAGHTYGIRGIWDFGRFLEPHCGSPAVDWQDVLDNAYSQEAELTGRFLQSLQWWRLEPRHDLIEDQVSDPKKRKVLALADDGSILAAYVPRTNARIMIDLREMEQDGTSLWYDPRTGEYSNGPAWSADNPSASFSTPNSAEDWVLLLAARGPVSVAGDHPRSDVSAGTDGGAAPPSSPILLGAAPNPFRSSTAVALNLAAPGRVRLAVYDMSGRLVRVLLDGDAAGRRSVVWDGIASDGRRTMPGVYVIRLETKGQVFAKKMVQLP
jgi:hypothetical protein